MRCRDYATDPYDTADDTLVGPAVDSKTVRGSRTGGTAVHRLTAALHACQTLIAQCEVAATSDELPASALLLDRTGLRGVVSTADTMRTQRARSKLVVTGGGHRPLVAERSRKEFRKERRSSFVGSRSPASCAR
ncbi:hypothetical protein AB0D11_27270 [Streptomyces monashensis]|uniref:hypothetical protein n=1 Tax=Streptomyces monashensis TaxID=1678012 RepID=UPI0033FF1B69